MDISSHCDKCVSNKQKSFCVVIKAFPGEWMISKQYAITCMIDLVFSDYQLVNKSGKKDHEDGNKFLWS